MDIFQYEGQERHGILVQLYDILRLYGSKIPGAKLHSLVLLSDCCPIE